MEDPIQSTPRRRTTSRPAARLAGVAAGQPSFRAEQTCYYPDCCAPVTAAAKAGEIELAAWGRHGYPGDRLPDDSLPGLSSVGCWNAAKAQSWGLREHRNEGIEFTFLFTGKFGIAVEGKQHTMSFDQMLVTRPWQPHQLGTPDLPAHHLAWLILDVGVRRPHQEWQWPSWIILEPADLKELTGFLRQNEQPLWAGSPELRRCFETIEQALRVKPLDRGLSAMRIAINSLLLQMLEFFRRKDIAMTEALTYAERSVEHFLAELLNALDRPWTVEQMAGNCDLGVTRFVHYVRQLTNQAPAEFLMQSRLEKACRLLKESSDPTVAAIARQCGFSSSQYFTRIFRRRFGCTPGEYRK